MSDESTLLSFASLLSAYTTRSSLEDLTHQLARPQAVIHSIARAMRPAASLHFSTSNPPQLAVLNEEDSAAYLERLELPATLLHEPPSLSLLASILLAHHLQVPYDTSSLHVTNKSWNGPSLPIKLGKGIVDGIGGMDLGTRGNLERITRQHRGGFCYSLNTAAAALLRGELPPKSQMTDSRHFILQASAFE